VGSVAQLEQLIELARQQGFEVRYEDLGGCGGGICEYGGKRWLFIDLAVSTEETWESLQAALNQAVAGDKDPAGPSIRVDGGINSVRKVASHPWDRDARRWVPASIVHWIQARIFVIPSRSLPCPSRNE
jgi:hypothetical protein